MIPYFDVFLVTSPADTMEARACGCPLAHMAYGVGTGMRLLKGSVGVSMRGGLMLLSDEKYDGGEGDMTELTREVVRECLSRGYQGVMLDFERPLERDLDQFARLLAPELLSRGLTLYTYPVYAGVSDETRVVISSSMVSGMLAERLVTARSRYPGHRLAVEIERLRRDIRLPDPNGMGQPLTLRELEERVEGRHVFFSNEMAAHYFTYKDGEGQTHFVLFDDARSFDEKIKIAVECGVHEGFLLYPDVRDMWGELKARIW